MFYFDIQAVKKLENNILTLNVESAIWKTGPHRKGEVKPKREKQYWGEYRTFFGERSQLVPSF